jgi:Lrp/AsnC family transcriptional regulator, leucine-responsive regulatory protein
MQLDRYDYQILKLLQQDGRMSNQDLADQIGLSPSPCLRRVRALEEAGIIQSYHALVDAKQLGYALMAIVSIAMDKHTGERFETFDEQISAIPEVLECLLITGQTADYQLKVIVKDLDHYQDLLLNRINRITGVTSVHTSFVLRKVVNTPHLPLDLGNPISS